MYSTCLFCTQSLGRNDAVEAFPVGRRLAFDAAKGRLWVVCPRCERWNLTPLEERWEAIEQCERLFGATRLRVSTEHVGLARLKEGLELVRIGAPQRPELAAWRYGDQFGRRYRKHVMVAAGVGVAAVGVVVAGPMMGLVSIGAIGPIMNGLNAVNGIYQSRRKVRVPLADGSMVTISRRHVRQVTLTSRRDGELRLAIPSTPADARRWLWSAVGAEQEPHEVTGAAVVRAAGAVLPVLNASGGAKKDVQTAVSLLEDASTPEALFAAAATAGRRRFRETTFRQGDEGGLLHIPHTMRLALEMAAHEEQERRALDGELADLERAWQQAEEIAGIADDMFLPAAADDFIRRNRK